MFKFFSMDPSVVPKKNVEIDLWSTKLRGFFDLTHSRTSFVDCENEGMYNVLCKRLTNLLESEELKYEQRIQIDELWRDYFAFSGASVDDVCGCEGDCNISDNIDCLKTIALPHLLYSYAKENTVDDVKTINLKSYERSSEYRDIKSVEWTGGPLQSMEEGKNKIAEAWGPLFKISPKIEILDRNVFSKWGRNYKNGLQQFSDAINEVSSKAELIIITKLGGSNNKSPQDLFKEIKEFIDGISSVRISFILCEKEQLFGHARWIKCGDIMACRLERGLDTFVPSNQEDEFEVIYSDINKANSRINQALMSESQNIDFIGLKNY